jgi:hypothetical protein
MDSPRRPFVIWVFLVGVLLAGCAPPLQTSAEDERAVIAAAVEAEADSTEDVPAHLVLQPTYTVPGIFWDGAPLGSVLPPASLDGLLALGIDSALADDFRNVAQVEDSLLPPLPTRYRISMNSVPILGLSIDSILRNPALRSGAGFEVLTSAYPGARALYSVSHVGFARARSRALIYVARSCGYLCGGGTLLELRRVGKEWRTTRRHPLWVS